MFKFCVAMMARGQIFRGWLALSLVSLVGLMIGFAAAGLIFNFVGGGGYVAVLLSAPLLFYFGAGVCVCMALLIETMWVFFGIYRLFSIPGRPVRSEIIKIFGGSAA